MLKFNTLILILIIVIWRLDCHKEALNEGFFIVLMNIIYSVEVNTNNKL